MFKHGTLQRRKFRLLDGRQDKYNRNKRSKKMKNVSGKKDNGPKEVVSKSSAEDIVKSAVMESGIMSPVLANDNLIFDSSASRTSTNISCDNISSSYSSDSEYFRNPEQSSQDIIQCSNTKCLSSHIPVLDYSSIQWSTFSAVLQNELAIPSITDYHRDVYQSITPKQQEHYNIGDSSSLYIPDLCREFTCEAINGGFNTGYF